jgi:hypothetical protein
MKCVSFSPQLLSEIFLTQRKIQRDMTLNILILVGALSKTWVCVSLLAVTAGSNFATGHGCLSVVSVVCCPVEDCAPYRSLVQRNPTECGV